MACFFQQRIYVRCLLLISFHRAGSARTRPSIIDIISLQRPRKVLAHTRVDEISRTLWHNFMAPFLIKTTYIFVCKARPVSRGQVQTKLRRAWSKGAIITWPSIFDCIFQELTGGRRGSLPSSLVFLERLNPARSPRDCMLCPSHLSTHEVPPRFTDISHCYNSRHHTRWPVVCSEVIYPKIISFGYPRQEGSGPKRTGTSASKATFL